MCRMGEASRLLNVGVVMYATLKHSQLHSQQHTHTRIHEHMQEETETSHARRTTGTLP